ncbi:MAG: hypothetical protein ACRCU6_06010 [Fusobacteriaceae bacterium]
MQDMKNFWKIKITKPNWFRLNKDPKTNTQKSLSKDSPLRDLLISDSDIKLLVELIGESSEIAGIEYPSFTKMGFQKVHDVINLMENGDVIGTVEKITDKKIKELLDIPSGEFLKFVKWIMGEIKKINHLYGTLSNKVMDSDDMAYQNAGSEELNKFRETMIYYSISKNPADWAAMRVIPFEEMFVKLMIDQSVSRINKRYLQIITRK